MTVVLISSGVGVTWLRRETAWLKPLPPYTIYSLRMEGVTLQSKEFQELRNAAAACLMVEAPGGFQPDDHSTNAQGWPRPCSWYQIIGYHHNGANLEMDLPRLKKAVESAMPRNGRSESWRLALIYPDGRVVYAD